MAISDGRWSPAALGGVGLGEGLDLARQVLRLLPTLTKLRAGGSFTVADLIESQARARADHPFVRFDEGGERQLTYGELNAAANRVASWAISQGLRRGDVVALLMENRPEYVVSWAGLAKAGVTTALINTHVSGKALRHALAAADAKLLVLGSECIERYATTSDDLAKPLDVWILRDPSRPGTDGDIGDWPQDAHDLDEAAESRPDDDPHPSVREGLLSGDNLFYIYTSGTTGLPKAARFSHVRFLGAGIGAALGLRMGSADVHYCALPLYHSAGGVMMVSTVLSVGATLALRRRFSASAFWDDCRRFGATRFQYIGEFCRYLLNQPHRPDDRSHAVKSIVGNGLRPDIWEEFQELFGIERIVEFYGATEANAFLMNTGGKVGSVGRIPMEALAKRFSDMRLLRFDVESGTHERDQAGSCIECGPDEAGELVARISTQPRTALGKFEGYTSKEATQKKILRDVFESGDSWFRSGDLLRRDAQGWYYFVDRIGDTFRWRGENVSTQEVAEILGGFPGLEMVNVYGVEIEGVEGRAGMAALVMDDDERRAFDAKAFYEFVEKSLPSYAAPVFARLLSEVDVTGTFKLRKVNLQEEGFDLERVDDPILFRDAEARRYVPLTPELRAEIRSGTRRV